MPSMSLGRARWTTEGGSIFSVADGRRLAQEPVRTPTPFERLRQSRVTKATLESPLVAGYRWALRMRHNILRYACISLFCLLSDSVLPHW